MPKNYLLEYSEELATKVEILCKSLIPFGTASKKYHSFILASK